MTSFSLATMNMPVHGGDLAWAANTFAIPKDKWLDLSTGIAPWSWPIPNVPCEVWRSLPPNDRSLECAAAAYFGCHQEQLLALPGSQFLIARLPHDLPLTSVAMPKIAYCEHRIAWQKAGHTIHLYDSEAQLTALVEQAVVSCAVVVQPNNPTAYAFHPDTLIALQKTLWDRHGRHGVLLVDEAFIDLNAEQSLCRRLREANCLVLRSLGKFFGLAGLRLGFVCAHESWISHYKSMVEPWLVSHPAHWIGAQALSDRRWINAQREKIMANSARTLACLKLYFGPYTICTQGLFHSVFGQCEFFEALFLDLAKQGVLVRYMPLDSGSAILRFGLPGDQLARLQQVLDTQNITANTAQV